MMASSKEHRQQSVFAKVRARSSMMCKVSRERVTLLVDSLEWRVLSLESYGVRESVGLLVGAKPKFAASSRKGILPGTGRDYYLSYQYAKNQKQTVWFSERSMFVRSTQYGLQAPVTRQSQINIPDTSSVV